jgi:hypothetical protein
MNCSFLLLTPVSISYCVDKSVPNSKCRQAALDDTRSSSGSPLVSGEVYEDSNCCGLPGIDKGAKNSEMLTFETTFKLFPYFDLICSVLLRAVKQKKFQC